MTEVIKPSDMEAKLEELREPLADLEHQQWAHLTKFFMNLRREASIRDRYGKLCRIPYSELPEDIKDKDRIWADKVIDLLKKKLRED